MSRETNCEKLNIMAVLCHPADAIDGPGGTLALHADRGDKVTVVVATHGLDTHDWQNLDRSRFAYGGTPDEQKLALGKKEKEVVEGLAILGITDVRFLRFPDELLMPRLELIEAIAVIMAEVKPHLLITHNPTEELGLADNGHAASAIAALRATSLANTPRFNKEPAGRSFPTQTFFMTMNGFTSRLTAEGFRHEDVVIDITGSIERKVRAMDCLRSQYYPGKLARKCLEVVNGRVGLHFRLPYAEGFQTYRPQCYTHLPLNPYLQKLSVTPVGESVRSLDILVNGF